MDSAFIVIDKDGRGGESIDSVYTNEQIAIERKEEISAYRVEEHIVHKEKPWNKEDESKWANEEYTILREQQKHNFGDS